MANDKLTELTRRLYEEGLSSGKVQGQKILSEAHSEADEIISKAKAEARRIVEQADRQAADLKAKAESDIRMASAQALSATKNDIESAVLSKLVDEKVDSALSDEGFVREIIMAAAKGFGSQDGPCELSVVLPQSISGSAADYVRKEVGTAIGKSISVTTSKKIKGGLQIGPSDGGYFISLSDETFKELIREYLRPATRKILFGE